VSSGIFWYISALMFVYLVGNYWYILLLELVGNILKVGIYKCVGDIS
jgi:hypothetical protein